MKTIIKNRDEEKPYFIRFAYLDDTEDAEETCLVYARSYMKACEKIIAKYKNAKNFRNLTLF